MAPHHQIESGAARTSGPRVSANNLETFKLRISLKDATTSCQLISLTTDSFDSYDPYTQATLGPLNPANFDSTMYRAWLFPQITTTIYGSLDWLRVNPAFKSVHTQTETNPSDDTPEYEVTIRIPSSTCPEILLHADEYVTDPPCRSITLARMGFYQDTGSWGVPVSHQYCWADNVKGLKVKDLLEVRDQIVASGGDAASFGESLEVVATFKVESLSPGQSTAYDCEIDRQYFDGPLPRYRKAGQKGSGAGAGAHIKDQALMWTPT